MLAERIGVTIPLKVIKHNYLVTEIIPGVSNLPNVRYYDGGIYLKVNIFWALTIQNNAFVWLVRDRILI